MATQRYFLASSVAVVTTANRLRSSSTLLNPLGLTELLTMHGAMQLEVGEGFEPPMSQHSRHALIECTCVSAFDHSANLPCSGQSLPPVSVTLFPCALLGRRDSNPQVSKERPPANRGTCCITILPRPICSYNITFSFDILTQRHLRCPISPSRIMR